MRAESTRVAPACVMPSRRWQKFVLEASTLLAEPAEDVQMAKQGTLTKGSTRRGRSARKAATEVVMSHEDIARRAFEIYLARGAGDGEALADWVQAERELLGMQ